MLPNFLVIGAAKAGTTSLWDFLKSHPEVYLPAEIKETNFFALEGTRPNFRGPADAEGINRGAITDLEAYQKLFDAVSDHKAVGEVATSYLYYPAAPLRIKAHIPDVKIIAVLRNPVDRAFSSYLHTIRDGRESVHDFAAALRLEDERIAANWEHIWHYKAMGFYYAQLSRYYELFDARQIKVYLFDDLVNDERAVLSDLMRFLGIDDTVEVRLKRLNASSHARVSRVNCIQSLVRGEHLIKRAARRLLPAPWLAQARIALTRRIEVTSAVRRELIQFFRDDIEKLAGLIGRDLSSWVS
jgi:hypothetical protein